MADREIRVETWEGKGFWRMAQVTLHDGTLAQQADILCITATLYEANSTGADGHVWQDDLEIGTHIFDVPQTGSEWSRDAIGYNFLHKFPGRLVGLEGGHEYELWHKLEFQGDDEDVERLLTRIRTLSVPEGER